MPLHHMSWSSDTQHPHTPANTVTDARINIVPLKTLRVDEHAFHSLHKTTDVTWLSHVRDFWLSGMSHTLALPSPEFHLNKICSSFLLWINLLCSLDIC